MKISEIQRGSMLDISIQNLDKLPIEKIRSIFTSPITITQKSDGVKLTLWRNQLEFDPKNYQNNWVVAYKNRIMYPEDFGNTPDDLTGSISISQFAAVHRHLRNVNRHLGNIPANTEFLVEFIMNKPTLTRDYHRHRDMILIGYSSTSAEIEGGMIRTIPSGFSQEKNAEYAASLHILTPVTLFSGRMNSSESIQKGIESSDLMKSYLVRATNIDFVDWTETYSQIREMLLDVPSRFGGTEEGVVINSNGKLYKILQDDQHDKQVRWEKKKRYQGSEEDEKRYWRSVRLVAKELAQDYANFKLPRRLVELNKDINNPSTSVPFHPKKTDHQVRDDVYITARELIIRSLPENNNALFLGKVRVMTNGHKKAMTSHRVHKLIVALTTGKDTVVPFEIRRRMVLAVIPDAQVIEVKSGNLRQAISKSNHLVRKVVAGSDRVENYRQQVPDIPVIEIPRTDEISATRVMQAIHDGDIDTFQKMTPKEIWPFYDQLRLLIS